jgi:hypothetical protein
MLFYGIELAPGTNAQSLVIEGSAILPTDNLAGGRLYFNTDTKKLELYDGTQWVPFVSGTIEAYDLPIAATDTLGGIKVGNGISVAPATGVASVTSGMFVQRSGDTMTGSLRAKSGAASPGNANNAGFNFSADNGTGLYSNAVASVQIVAGGNEIMSANATEAVSFSRQIRAPKGLPEAANASKIPGYAFGSDGDTGIFSYGPYDATAGFLVFMMNNVIEGTIRPGMRGNGYTWLASGILIQWGSNVDPAGGVNGNGQIHNFPIPFPNAVLNITGTEGGGFGWDDIPGECHPTLHSFAKRNNSSFYHFGASVGTSPGNYTPFFNHGLGFDWVAIGY